MYSVWRNETRLEQALHQPLDVVPPRASQILQDRRSCGRGCHYGSRFSGAKRLRPPTEKLLKGDEEARVIAMRLGPPPQGYANWTLRLLARKVVELAIVESISHETVRRTLKKTG